MFKAKIDLKKIAMSDVIYFVIDKLKNKYNNENKDNKELKITKRIGIRELARNSNMLDDYDYIEVEDKKTHKYKGLFVSPKWSEEFKSFLKQKIASEQQKKLSRFMKYASKGKIDERFNALSSSQINEKVAKEIHGQ